LNPAKTPRKKDLKKRLDDSVKALKEAKRKKRIRKEKGLAGRRIGPGALQRMITVDRARDAQRAFAFEKEIYEHWHGQYRQRCCCGRRRGLASTS
jgi:hypothetical protein